MVADNADTEWGQLAETDEASRKASMTARYKELAGLDEDARRARLTAMAKAEYALPDDKLRPFTVSRMRTWIDLPHDEAVLIAGSYDAVMRGMPGTVAMRRVSMVQTLVREFSSDDEEKLRELVPGVFAGAPSRTGLAVSAAPEHQSMEIASARKKPFWAFWQK